MGYSTDFYGELRLSRWLTDEEAIFLDKEVWGKPVGKPEWEKYLRGGGERWLGAMDLCLSSRGGVTWDGMEKTRSLPEAVTVLMGILGDFNPPVKLSGSLRAEGEDPDDRWILFVATEGGFAYEQKIEEAEECPYCHRVGPERCE